MLLSWEGERMILNLPKRHIMTFMAEMYAFFYKNGPTFISQLSVEMKMVLVTRHETVHHKKKTILFFRSKQ